LLDYLFGLLEGSELAETREHLNACPHCQAALAKAKSEQSLLGKAARAVTEVAEFTLPTEKPAPMPDTIPMMPVVRKQTGWRRTTWVAWSAAAAVFLIVVTSLGYHRVNLDRHRDALLARQNEYKKATSQLATLPAKYDKQHQAAIKIAQAGAGPHLHVVGPTTLQANAKGHLRITTRTLEGAAVASHLYIKLLDAQNKNIVKMLPPLQADHEGHAFVEIDAGRAEPGSTLTLQVEAEAGKGSSQLQETIRILEPTFVTRIDTNKIVYQLKDVLFFRALILDRYSLTPPAKPIPMRVTLNDSKNQVVRTVDLPTGDGGIVASSFLIDEKVQTGNYTLHVQPIDAQARVQSAAQRLEIMRELPVQILVRLDKDKYLPGDKVKVEIFSAQPLATEGNIDGKKVEITPAPAFGGAGGAGGAPGGPEGKGRPTTGADSLRVEATIPANVSPDGNVPFVIPLKDGKNKIQTNIPIGPTDFTIDFFPEGGDLLAGVPNRIFYRVRSKSGQPVTGNGRVMLLAGKNEIPAYDSTYDLGMGYLDFIPDVKETYAVRITTPTKVESLPVSFAAIGGIRTSGVVLQVAEESGEDRTPRAVARQGDPIRFTIRRQGVPRKLLVLAQCRGQIVDQRWVDFEKDSIDVTLQPTQEANGMIRITAYELHDKLLQPVAERLVYRAAAKRLDLGFELHAPQQLEPGRSVSGKATARDENKQPAAAWLLASIIDERFQTRPRSLSAHFFLLNEVRAGADLDNAQLILHDSAESAQVLERFLGTHGWRRFLRTDEPDIHLANAKDPVQPLVFSRENMPVGEMQKQYDAALAQALKPIHLEAFREEQELTRERDSLAAALQMASTELAVLEIQPQLWFRLGMGLLLAVLLGSALVLMGIGAYRIARAERPATTAFASSFACLAGCLLLLFAGSWFGQLELGERPAALAGVQGDAVREKLDKQFAAVPILPHVRDTQATGFFPLRAPREKTDGVGKGDLESAKMAMDDGAKDAVALREQLARSIAKGMGRGNVMATADLMQSKGGAPIGSPAWQQMQKSKKAGEKKSAKKESPNIPAPPSKPPAGGGPEAELKNDDRQFAYEKSPHLLTDTLLWQPALWLANGNADVPFVLGAGDATYRVLLLGHSPTGRFGFFEQRLDVGR
jgi:hypothetical protein